MNETGLKVLMISKSDHDIGGDCLNDGCIPSNPALTSNEFHFLSLLKLSGNN